MIRRVDRIVGAWRLLRPRNAAETRREVDLARRDIQGLHNKIRDVAQTARVIEEMRGEISSLKEAIERIEKGQLQLKAVAQRELEVYPHHDALSALMGDPAVSTHVRCRVEKAEVCGDPCPHVVIDDILPRTLFEALIRALPPAVLFDGDGPNKQELKVPLRLAPLYAARVWRHFIDSVLVRDLMPALVDRFRPALNDWMRSSFSAGGDDPIGDVPLMAFHPRILLRTRGYAIPPHRYPKWAFLTILLYLARDGDKESWGTQLFHIEQDAEAQGTAPHWIEPSRCTMVKDVGFVPNRMMVFMNSTGAHGARISEQEDEGIERHCLQLRIGPKPDARERLLASMPEERRALWTRQEQRFRRPEW